MFVGCHFARVDGRGGYLAGMQESEQKTGRVVSNGVAVYLSLFVLRYLDIGTFFTNN